MRFVLALFVTGCLSNPTPHPADDTGPNLTNETTPETGVGADADVMTPEQEVTPETSSEAIGDTGETSELTPEPFPPTRPVNVREVQVRDLDGDGTDDLLVISTPTRVGEAASDWGVYVFFDVAARADLSTSDLFIATQPIPDGVLVANVHGTSAPELVVFGQHNDQGVVEVISFAGRTEQSRQHIEARFVPRGGVSPDSGAPVGVVATDVNNDAITDLILYDLTNIDVRVVEDWTPSGLPRSDWLGVWTDTPWLAVVRVIPVRYGSNNWLVVSQQFGKTHFYPYVDGVLDTNDTWVDTGTAQHGTTVADLDADGVPEIVGFVDLVLTIKTLTPPTAQGWRYKGQMPLSGNHLEDLVIGDVDGNGSLDILALEAPGQTAGRLQVARDVRVDEGAVELTNWRATDVGLGVDPYRLAFVGGRVWAIAVDGASDCYQWNSGTNALARCP